MTAHDNHKTTGITYTPEQQKILDLVEHTNDNIVIVAGAGAAKTTMLVATAEFLAKQHKRAIYIALTKAMTADIGHQFTSGNVHSCTIHSLAWRVAHALKDVKPLIAKFNNEDVTDYRTHHKHLGVTDKIHYKNKDTGKPHTVSAPQIARAAINAVTAWCQSDRNKIGVDDVEKPFNMPDATFDRDYAPIIIKWADKVWQDVCDPEGRIRFTHDHYLKLVSLKKPLITKYTSFVSPGDAILFDEAQDSRPCVTSWLAAQTDLRLISVGDTSQAIFGSFTGAVDAIPDLITKPNTSVAKLTHSFRFGPPVATLANHCLKILDAPITLTGAGGPSKVVVYDRDKGLPTKSCDVILVRSNAGVIEAIHNSVNKGKTPAMVGNPQQLLDVVYDFTRLKQNKGKPRTPEMREFSSFDDVKEFIQDQQNGDQALKTLLRRLMRHGEYPIKQAIFASVTEDKPHDITISTIHKAKGRQWDNVVLAFDDDEIIPGVNPLLPIDDYEPELDFDSREAIMLLYVAITRAKKKLWIPSNIVDSLEELEHKLEL